MSVPTTLEAVLIIVLILLPGYVCSVVLGSTLAHVSESVDYRYILRVLALGVGVHGLMFPWSRNLVRDYVDNQLDVGGWELWIWSVSTVFAVPVGVGLILGWLVPHPQVDALLDKVGLGWVDRLPSAWDYAARLGPCWVRIYLDDGSVVGGRYANRSVASIKPGRNDLYIEEVYLLDEAGNLSEPINDSLGIWIRADTMVRVEFLAESRIDDEGNKGETDSHAHPTES